MDFEQIKQDVNKFQNIASSHGMMGYCMLGSLILERCLSDHGIRSELVKGYLIVENEHWALHIWNKIYLQGAEHQIDIVYNPLKEAGIQVGYALKLEDKWKSLIDTKKEQKDYNNIVQVYEYYHKHGGNKTMKYLSNHQNKSRNDVWRKIFTYAARLRTFRSIIKYRSMLL
jgi:hypothetical protein